MSYNKPKQKKDDKNELYMSELCKGLNKFRKRFEDKWDQFEHGEITLRGIISVAMVRIILDQMGDKLRYAGPEVKLLSVDWNEEVPLEGVLINVIKEKNRFKITLKNTKGQIETHFIPLKAVKLEFDWLH